MNEEKSYFEQMLDFIQAAYQNYNNKFEVVSTDNFIRKSSKIIGRILVLLLMIAFSPILFIGLFVAFIGVF